MKHNVLVTRKEEVSGVRCLWPQLSGIEVGTNNSRDLDYPNSSSDCSIRVFCQQVYVLLEYFVTVVYSTRVVQ